VGGPSSTQDRAGERATSTEVVLNERCGTRAGVWIATWTGALATTLALSLGRAADRVDETWMLWVLHRVASGDVLYRDVYDVSTPFPAWLGAAVVGVTTTQLVVLRVLVAAVIAAEVAVAASIVRRAGLRWPGVVVLAVAVLVFAGPALVFASFYSALAVLGALVALRILQAWLGARERSSRAIGLLAAAGGAGAWSFWCKPNIGALTLVAVGLTVWGACGWRAWRATARALVPVAAAAGAVSACTVAALVVTGAWSAFVDQVVLSKPQYVRVGFSYATAIEHRLTALVDNDAPGARSIAALVVLAAPLLVIVAIGWSIWRGRHGRDPRLVAFASFGGVALLGVYPRPGADHIGTILPLALAAATGALVVTRTEQDARVLARSRGLAAATVVVALGAALAVAASIDAWTEADVVRDVPHLAVAAVPRVVAREAAALGRGLHARGIRRVFVAREDASFFYVAAGIDDPLPYDIPERSDFGAAGQAGVIRRLQAGASPWVCLQRWRPPAARDDPLVPRAIERWVRAHGERVAKLPKCALYRLPAPAGGPTGS